MMQPVSSQSASLPLPIGHKDHSGVPVAPTVPLGRIDEPLDLALGQVLTGPQGGVGKPLRQNCSICGGWRDQSQVLFGHGFRAPCGTDCEPRREFLGGDSHAGQCPLWAKSGLVASGLLLHSS